MHLMDRVRHVRRVARGARLRTVIAASTLAGIAAGSAACARQQTTAAATPRTARSTESRINRLTRAEERAGWKLLFDGKTLKGWRGFRSEDVPTGWEVRDGVLWRIASGGDLLTARRYRNFELSLDWNISAGGNSGILYRVLDAGDAPYESGPEMQVLDDARHPDGRSRLTAAGSVFGLYPVPAGIVRPAGEWNTVRIVVDGNHVQHWLNGHKVVDYQLGSPDWAQRVANSKFRQWPLYGTAREGFIALQDHESDVAFRNIKIKVLP